MKFQHVKEIRAFNMFYTNVIGLLDRHILDNSYSLPEVRIMFELYHNSELTASDIIALIDIDKGYLSRILKKFEKNKLLHKVNSSKDKRVHVIQLSAKGKKAFETLNKRSDKQVENLFKNLSEDDCNKLIKKFLEVQKLLKKGLSHKENE